MRIDIDARELVGRPTGVGRHMSGLLAESADSAARVRQFVLYAHAAIPDVPQLFVIKIVPGTSGAWWQQVQLPRAVRSDRLDLFFAPPYTAPLRIPPGVPLRNTRVRSEREPKVLSSDPSSIVGTCPTRVRLPVR